MFKNVMCDLKLVGAPVFFYPPAHLKRTGSSRSTFYLEAKARPALHNEVAHYLAKDHLKVKSALSC